MMLNLDSKANPIRFLFAIDRNYLLVSAGLLCFIIWVLISGRQGPLIELFDYWEHTACIKEMSRNLLNPQNPFLRIGGDTTPRYTPYIFLLALFKKISGINLFVLLGITSIINFIVLATGLYLFCGEYFRDREQPLYTLVTLLFLWGGVFNFSSEYNLRFLSYTLFYPSIATFALSFAGLYYFVAFVRYNKRKDFWVYLFLSVFIVISHPLTGSFYMLSAFLLAVSEGSNRIRNLGIFFSSALVACILLIIWPYFPFLKALSNTVSTPWAEETRMYLYRPSNLYKMGPAILGIPVVLIFLKKRKYPLISFGFIICASIYIFTYKPKIYIGERYIFYMIFFMHLALSWYLRTLGILSVNNIKKTLLNLNEKNIHVLVFVVIFILGVACQILRIGFEQLGYTIYFKPRPVVEKYTDPTEKYKILKGTLKEGDVVMSDPLTAWLIPTLTDAKIVALYHDNPLGTDNVQRVKDSITLYRSDTPLQIREKILQKYNVTHVLLNFDRMEKTAANETNNYYKDFRIEESTIGDLRKVGGVILKNETFTLLKLDTDYRRRLR